MSSVPRGFVWQVFRCAIPWEEERGPAWAHCWSPRSGRSILTEWWWLSLYFLLRKCLTPLWSRITRRSQCTSWWRTRTSVWYWTTRLFTISASGRWSSSLLHVSNRRCRGQCFGFVLVSGEGKCLMLFLTGLWYALFSWGLEPSHQCNDERCDLLPSIPRSAELRSSKACCESDSFPTAALFHGGVCTADIEGFTAVQIIDSSRAYPANVGCKEHDVRGGPEARQIPDSICDVSRENEHEGGGRADDQRAKQELFVLRGVDP